jgi:proteasome alpha subunit
MGLAFTHESKPLEVEILIAEVGSDASSDRLFHIMYDGTVTDESQYCILGGDTEAISQRLSSKVDPTAPLGSALLLATQALSGPDRTLKCDDLEVAILARSNQRRCFARVSDEEVTALLES